MELPIDIERLGAVYTGQVEPVMPWIEGPDGKRRPGTEQERDQATGAPLWTVHAMVAAGERPTLIAVRVPSPTCPEPTPFTVASFERLVCTARVNRTSGQLGTYWSAAGVGTERRTPVRAGSSNGEGGS